MGRADVVVCGAGIAGVAAAYHLTVRQGITGVVVCDPRPPLSLTSDKSTECYRNWWPRAEMVALMNRSIDLMEEMAAESGNAFGMNRRGYLYVTADPARLERLEAEGRAISELGAGVLRVHRSGTGGYRPPTPGGVDGPTGADLIADPGLLRRHFPYLAEYAVGALHVRRAGWLSAQQLGAWMLDRAREAGARMKRREVTGVAVSHDAVSGVELDDGSTISTGSVVDAAGPMLGRVGAMLGADLPVTSEVHHKVAFRDTFGAVPRDAPLLIWWDPQHIDWTVEERSALAGSGRADLLGEMPAACHGRPEGGADSPWALALWEYRRRVIDPVWPLPLDPLYPEVVIRGMARMIPALGAYRERLPHTVVDGGYYTKTAENRPLIGPTGVRGGYVCGALSGFGVMAAAAAGELVAAHLVGEPLPDYAPAFDPDRPPDPQDRAGDGQL